MQIAASGRVEGGMARRGAEVMQEAWSASDGCGFVALPALNPSLALGASCVALAAAKRR